MRCREHQPLETWRDLGFPICKMGCRPLSYLLCRVIGGFGGLVIEADEAISYCFHFHKVDFSSFHSQGFPK